MQSTIQSTAALRRSIFCALNPQKLMVVHMQCLLHCFLSRRKGGGGKFPEFPFGQLCGSLVVHVYPLKAGSHGSYNASTSISASTRKNTCETGRRKHKRKKENVLFSYSYSCACVAPVHTYFSLCLRLCLRRTREPALRL